MQLKRVTQTGKRVVATAALAIATAATALGQAAPALAAPVEGPASSKTLTDRGDGTYDLTLSVTGVASSATTKNKANVILVMDTSGSMGFHAKSETGRYASDDDGDSVDQLYYKQGNSYLPLTNDSYTGTVYTRERGWGGYNYYAYTGDRFSAQTRLDVAKAASSGLVQTLEANNTSATDDTVEISLVSFAGYANPGSASNVSWSKGNNMSGLENKIAGMSASGGTNWDDALHVAKAAADAKKASQPDEQTYIIFVSDGDPTYYMNGSHTSRNGNGSSVTNSCYNAAADEATAINNAGYGFYAVGAFGNVTRMESLATAGGGEYYSAANTTDLNNAFASIISSITNAANFQNVTITDGITPATASTVLGEHASAGDFTYTISAPGGTTYEVVLNEDGTIKTVNGGTTAVTLNDIAGNQLVLAPGTAFPAATKAEGGVKWDLSSLGTLLNGYTYSVSFVVWPSQQAYDTVAKLNDGLLAWEDVDQTMFHRTQQPDGTYAYSLVTNTDAKVDYTAVQTENGEVVSSVNGSSTVSAHPTITLRDTTMGAKKEWVGEHSNDPITFALYVDGKDSGGRLTLSGDNNWEGSIHIAPGLKVNGEVLEEGHDYQLIELTPHSDYEFTSVVAHPMLVDSATAITDPAGNAVTLTAKNVRKSTLDITKAVNDVTGGANPDAEFTFDVTVQDSDATLENVTYQIVSADGTVGAAQIMKNGSTQEIKIKAGEKIHFPALTTGSTYTAVEKNLPAGYSTDKDTQEGSIDEGNTAYTADFLNNYEAASVTANFPVRKVLATSDGLLAPNIAGKYTFTLSAATGTPMPATTAAVNPEATGGMAVFGDITYTMPGTYVYSVRESGTVAGVSNDSTPAKNVTVTVTDDGTGKLSAVASSTMADPLTFTNTYSVGEVQATISAEKILEVASGDNAPDVAGKYTFTLTGADGQQLGTVKSGASGATVDFAPITYTKPGTYTYKVTESGQLDGVTNDAAAQAGKTVTVVVSDNSDGTMSAVVNGGNGPVVFTNSYQVEQTSLEIPVRKVLETKSGDNAPDVTGAYTFRLTDAEGNEIRDVACGASGETVNFAKIDYTEPGTYTYTVTEDGQLAGVTNDADAESGKTVTVTVTDNGDGTMSAACDSTEESPVTFTNTYSAAPATAGIVVKKDVTADEGLTAPDVTGKFAFALTANDGAPLPATTTATNPDADGGTVTFGDITYDKPGTYTYKVTESGQVAGFTNDADATTGKTVTVTVTDDGQGHLVAESDATADKPLTFTNHYSATPATLVGDEVSVKKSLVGRDWTDADSFDIQMTAKTAGAPMPEGSSDGSKTVAATKPATGAVSGVTFGGITFTKPGTYVYEIVEKNAGKTIDGVTYDSANTGTITLTATVTDGGDGKLYVTSSIDKPEGFTNSYKPAATTASFPVKKVVTADEGLTAPSVASKFTFKLEAVDNAPMPEATEVTNPDADGGTVTFGDITYDKPGTYTYKVTESGQVAGFTNDADATTGKTVTVTVTDNGDGTMTAVATSTTDKPLTFTNRYSVGEAQADISVRKMLEAPEGANPPSTADAFTFTLTGADGQQVGTVKSGEAGDTVKFAPITYTKPGAYTYTVTESGQLAGVTNDADATTGKTVTVTVTDNGDGTLSAVASTDNEPVTFTNTYGAAPVTASFPVRKDLATSDGLTAPDISGKFTFTLTAADGTPLPATTTATNPDADGGTVTFGDMTYTKTGTYTYTVTETGKADGVSNDSTSAKTVTVAVTDDGQGHLVATPSSTTDKPLTFSNTYSVGEVQATISAKKNLESTNGTNLPSTAGAFTFTLTGADGQQVGTVKSGEAGATVDFAPITYTKPGTYTYTVTESGQLAGVTNDAEAATGKTVTVVVSDNSDGTMSAVVNDGNGPVTFTNTYEPAATTASFPVTKVVTADEGLTAPPVTGAFTFKLEAVGGAPLPATTTATNPDADGGTVTFGDITYDKPGTYTYKVTESGTVAGFTNDAEATTGKTVTVTVTDNGDGTMTATPSATADAPVTFTNHYSAEPGELTSLSDAFRKTLEGRDWTADDKFEFTMTAKTENAPMPEGSSDGSKTVEVTKPETGATVAGTFGDITYAKPGTYVYEIAEKNAGKTINGVAYDSTNTGTVTLTVTVRDGGNGHLYASAQTDKATDFTNSYSAGETTVDTAKVGLNKVFTGKAWDGDEFTFTLTGADNAPMPEKDTVTVSAPDQDGGSTAAFGFGTITYDKAGTYTYEVAETAGDNAGIAYDDHKATVTVTVTDDGQGNLVAADPVVTDGTFTNTYSASETRVDTADFGLTKVLEGRDWKDSDSFEFTLAGVDNAPMPATTTATVTKPADGSTASFGFGTIAYDKAGTYSYTVSETAGSIGGITYDRHVAHVTVTVTDNGQGQLVAGTAVVTDGTFTNTYSTTNATVATADLGFQKSFTGRAWTGDDFAFTLKPTTDGAPMPANDTVTVSGPDQPGGTTAAFGFGTIAYDKPGTYEYDVAETAGDNAGITYDRHAAHVTVTVTDDGEGHLVADTKVDGDATFQNSYAATPASVTLTGTKTLANRQITDGEFAFTVADKNGEVVANAQNAADGSLSFSPIEYTSERLAAAVQSGAATLVSGDAADTYTFQYTVAERTDILPGGVTPVTSSYQVQVKVTDNRSGALTAEVTYPDGGLAFENTYGADATAEVNLNGAKVLKVLSGDNAPDITGKYTFTITPTTDDAPMPEHATVTNDAAGNVDFGKVSFSMESVFGTPADGNEGDIDISKVDVEPAAPKRTRTYTYTVTESGDVPGVTNDTSTKTITITVTDNADGTLTATVEGNGFTFTNTYAVQPKSSSVTDAVSVKKNLEGRDLAEGEFEFALSDARGTVISTAKNGADGTVAFDPIEFTEPGIHTYTVSEIAGTASGVTYDSTTHAVTATVTDNGDGTLSVAWAADASADANGIVFANAYQAAPTSVTLTAAKELKGRKLADGEFEFTLSQDGQTLQTVKNAADGTVAFAPVTFDAAGEYDLQIAEVKGADKNVTYDEAVHTAHVTVTDDGQGHLSAEVTYDGDAAPVFTNTYTAPPAPKPDEPKPTPKPTPVAVPVTGDASNPAVPLALAGMVASGLAIALVLRTRRN